MPPKSLSLVLLLVALLGCSPRPAQPPSQGQTAGGAAATAIGAGTLWSAGGGCRLQGCPYGSYCNRQSGFCDSKKCDEGCPEGTVCNEGLGRCQDPPPASTPNDFLPQDNVRNRPPGTQ